MSNDFVPFKPLTGWTGKRRCWPLTPCAPGESRGRLHPEPAHPYRTLYQRDRDRIVHCTAFRRLMHKTQVLVTQTNDHHRTRLTHTLEVAQISRTIARRLGLNEDLTEAIALSHDLGHPPFGHAGEQALDECMRDHGGFEHNLHGLRIVEQLEYPYAAFPGLNLSWEVQEAMALHSRKLDRPETRPFAQASASRCWRPRSPTAADSLAYDAHDVDDALSVGLITPADLDDVTFWRQALEQVKQHERLPASGAIPVHHGPDPDRLAGERPAGANAAAPAPGTDRHGRGCAPPPRPPGRSGSGDVPRSRPSWRISCIGASTSTTGCSAWRSRAGGSCKCCSTSFAGPRCCCRNATTGASAGEGTERVVCDYLAGMTDRYAQDEYLRLFQPYSIV